MEMKKTAMTLLALTLMMPAMAQRYGQEYGKTVSSSFTEDHSIYYGLRLGLALATVNSDDARLDGGSCQAGLNLGGVIGFQLSPVYPVYLESGLTYTEKGGKGYVEGKKFTYSLNYLEMPIIAKYRYELDSDISVQPFAGGYVAMGVGGKVKDYGERTTTSSFSSNFFERFDGGLRLGCGFEYELIYAEAAYDLGLTNISHDDFESSRNRCFYINIGVNF